MPTIGRFRKSVAKSIPLCNQNCAKLVSHHNIDIPITVALILQI